MIMGNVGAPIITGKDNYAVIVIVTLWKKNKF
jgi:hypothetical protein